MVHSVRLPRRAIHTLNMFCFAKLGDLTTAHAYNVALVGLNKPWGKTRFDVIHVGFQLSAVSFKRFFVLCTFKGQKPMIYTRRV